MKEQSRQSQVSQSQPQLLSGSPASKPQIWYEATPCSEQPKPCPPLPKPPCNCGGCTQIITPKPNPVHRTSWALFGLSFLLFLSSLLSSFLLLFLRPEPVNSQVTTPGPQGPAGPQGPVGPQGPPAALW